MPGTKGARYNYIKNNNQERMDFTMLKCGFFETDITPGLGSDIPGYFEPWYSKMILDPLYAHAFAAQTDGDPIVIISLDSATVQEQDSLRIRQGIFEETGIPTSNISICATHIHTGGPVCNLYGCLREDDYCDFMVKRSIDAGIMAFRNLADAKIGAASCDVEGIAFNRRFLLKSGEVRMNPGRLNPDIVKSVDIVDPQLLVLRVDHADGTPMGVITNYALHCDCVRGSTPLPAYSADFPGVIRKRMREAYGQDLACVFLTGACGNVNSVDVTKPREESKNYLPIGNILADAAKELFDSIVTEDTDIVKCIDNETVCRMRRPTMELYEKVQIEVYKKEMLKVMGLPEEDVTVRAWTARIGDCAIHMLPGELFAYFGLELKKRTDCKHTFVAELSNQGIGYIYTKEAEVQGGYEAIPSTYVIMNSDTGYRMVDAAIDNISKLL